VTRAMIRTVPKSLFYAVVLASALCCALPRVPGIEQAAFAGSLDDQVFRGTPVETFMSGKLASVDIPRTSLRESKEEVSSQGSSKPGAEEQKQPHDTGPDRSVSGTGPSTRPSTSSELSSPEKAPCQPHSSDIATLISQAEALAGDGKHAAALAKYTAAVSKATEEKNKKLTATALRGAAQAAYTLGKPGDALSQIQRAIAINQELKNARARSLDYLLAGRVYLALSKPGAALQSFDEAQKILPVSESAAMPVLLENKGTCLVRLLRYSDALKVLARAYGLRVKEGNEVESARLSVQIGEIHVSRSEYRLAVPYFAKAKEIYKKLNRSRELGGTLYRIAYVHQMLGDLKTAEEAAQEGQSLLPTDREAGVSALPLLVRGTRAYRDGKVNQAGQDLAAALRLCEKSGDRMMGARIRLTLAQVQLDCSRPGSALELAGKSLADFRSLSSVSGEASALLFIGKVYFRQGFVQKALEYAQEASKLGKKIGDRDHAIEACILLADIHDGLGDATSAGKMLQVGLDYARGGANVRTRADLGLAVARYRVARDQLDRALQAVGAARKMFEEIHDRRGTADCDHLQGLVYELQGDREKAVSSLKLALKAHRAMWDRYGEGRDLTVIGVHFKNLGDHGQAMEYFRKALDLRKGIGDQRGYAANLVNVGNVLRHQNEVPEALKHLQQALSIYRQLSDRKGEADVLTNIGNVEAARGTLSSALDNFSKALTIHRDIRDNRGIATDLSSMGRAYLSKGDPESASKYLEDAEKVYGSIRDPRGEAALLADLAMVQRAKRNTKSALSLLAKARQLAKPTGDNATVSSIDLKMAGVYEDMHEYGKALDLVGRTLEAARAQRDRSKEAWALGGLGIIQAKMEDYENALKNLLEARRLSMELGLPPSRSRDLDFYLGEIYDGFRDYERALEHYQQALSLYQASGHDEILGRIYDRIGNIYYRTEDYSKAKTFFEDAVRASGETRNVAMQQSQLIRLGDIASKLGSSEEALKYQQRALALTKESGDQRSEALVLTRIGTLYQLLGRPKTALETYQEAQDIRTKLGDKRGVNENLLQIALVTSTLGNFEAAVSDLKRAFEIAQCSEDRSMLWKAYFIMGRALEGKKRLGEALESYRKAITILEAMEADIMEESEEDDFIFGGKTALFETTLRVLMSLARKDPQGAYDNQALRIVEKLKAAEYENALSKINVEHFSDLPQELLIKEKSLKLALRRLNARLAEARAAINPSQATIQKLLAERRAKEKSFVELKERLTKEYPAYAELRYPRPVSVHRIQREILTNDEAVLEYMVTRSRTYLFAIDRQRFHTFSIQYPGTEIEKDVEALTKPLCRADTPANWDPSVAFRLYAKLIKPVEYFIAGKKSVVIVPHGPLCALPFEILVSSESHANKRFWSAKDQPSYLVEKYAFCYAPSLSMLSRVRTRKRIRKPGWNLVAFGDAVYSDDDKSMERNPGSERLIAAVQTAARGSRGPQLRPLPGTRKEISEIVGIVGGPTQTYLGAQATETLFKKADLARYNYIHLATHGVLLNGSGKFQQQPAIVFSLYGDKENDGFLQLGEVFGLQLNADLVVLSSCLTPGNIRLTETNGFMGLARAFLFAGTDSVVLSMWQVSDDSTEKFFVDMYRNLQTETKAEALRQAKLSMLSNPETSHPYYWAPFVLVGNWQNTFNPAVNRLTPERIKFKGISAWRRWLNM
jgi:CHAT domain-containing protein/Tfp pilus assembly protein PilF